MSLFNGNAAALVFGDTAVSCMRQSDPRVTRTPVFGIWERHGSDFRWIHARLRDIVISLLSLRDELLYSASIIEACIF